MIIKALKLQLLLAAAGALLLIGLFLVAVAPARAGDVEKRIKAVEDELAQLVGEQAQMREDALAAKARLPRFNYRPGEGLSIWAADRSWGFRTRIQWHHRLNFWPDTDAVATAGFSQWDQQLRRVRPKFTYYWDKGFYELDFQLDLQRDRSVGIHKAEFKVRFDKINPWLPFLSIGPRMSAFFNKHDTNWSSPVGALFERSMMQSGAGLTSGTQVNAMGLDWRNLPVGPGVIRLFQVIISNNGLQSQSTAGQVNALNDNKGFHTGIWTEPFRKTKNKWIKGIDFGFGAQLEDIHTSSSGRRSFRVRTTERPRLRLIEVNEDLRGMRVYLTPGLGWKVGPYWLRLATGHNRGRFSNINNSRTTPGRGSLVKGDMWRIMQELWIWSPKGFFTGSTYRAGSLQLATGFERVEYEAPNNGLRDCSSFRAVGATSNGGAECTRAHAINANIVMWYFIRPGLSVGMEWSHYRVNKIGRGGFDIERKATSCRSAASKCGKSVTFNSLELGIRVEW